MPKINVRGLFHKEVELSSDQYAEIEKMRLQVERIRLENGPNQETRQHILWTRTITIFTSLVILSLFFGTIIGPITNSITKYQILKLGYQDICDDYIKDENARQLYDAKFKMEVFRAGGVLVNNNIVNTKKDTVVIVKQPVIVSEKK